MMIFDVIGENSSTYPEFCQKFSTELISDFLNFPWGRSSIFSLPFWIRLGIQFRK